MGEKNQLVIPPRAKADPKSFELIRAWVGEGDLHVSLQGGGWDDPSAWGVVLADLVGHVANFYSQQKGADPQRTAAKIRAAMEEALDEQEEMPEGNLVE